MRNLAAQCLAPHRVRVCRPQGPVLKRIRLVPQARVYARSKPPLSIKLKKELVYFGKGCLSKGIFLANKLEKKNVPIKCRKHVAPGFFFFSISFRLGLVNLVPADWQLFFISPYISFRFIDS
jgi:hypothetical protein